MSPPPGPIQAGVADRRVVFDLLDELRLAWEGILIEQLRPALNARGRHPSVVMLDEQRAALRALVRRRQGEGT